MSAIDAVPDNRTERPRDPAIERVIVLLFVNLALALLFALLTLVFRHGVIDYQLAREAASHAGAARRATARASLSRTLWSRPVEVLVISALYVWVAKRLRQRSRRAFLRVRMVSLLGLAADLYLVVSAQYPVWLRVIQCAQAGVLALLAIAVNGRGLRAEFATQKVARTGSRRAAWALVLTSPLVAEVLLGSTTVKEIWLLALWCPIYGAGALLIRELAWRFGRGWPSVLMLGLAYGIVEEGIALQSLSSPKLYGAAHWAPRVLGMNSAYTELNLVYHMVFSVAIPVLLMDLAFPAHRRRPYLRPGGTVIAAICWLLGVALLRLSVPPHEDPGYVAPVPVLAGCAAAVALLVLVAFTSPARRASRPPSTRAVPGPRTVFLVGLLAGFGYLALLFPFGGASHPAFTHGAWTLLPMAAAAGLAIAVLAALRRWAASARWSDRHVFSLAAGALVGHTAFGVVRLSHDYVNSLGLIGLGGVMVWLLWRLACRIPG